jgi:hypothetical protein
MPYRSQAPPPVRAVGDHFEVYVGSPISEKPVTPVTAVTEILDMPLSRFASDGRAIELRVPWLPETVWFVPGPTQAASLLAKGVSPGRIWTASELALLYRAPKISAKDIQTLGRIKVQLDAVLEVVENLAPESEPDDEQR